MNREISRKPNYLIGRAALLTAALFLISETAIAREVEPLYLYAPPSKGAYGGRPARSEHNHSSHDHSKIKKGGKEAKKKSSGRPSHGGKIKGPKKHESEHRAMPKRSYLLSSADISAKAETYLMRPDGTMDQARLVREKGKARVEYETPMGDGPAHGANNVYVVDKKVEKGTLIVRTAKWINIHHSCGWGHDHRYDEQRNSPKSLNDIPLEITFDKLWSGNFHAAVLSGDMLHIKALHYGKPAAGVKLSVSTQQRWTKRLRTDNEGNTSFRLIEDYFSDDWGKFKRRNTGAFTVVARYDTAESGEYDGQKYDNVSMVTSFHWKYYPAKEGYTSYAAGLYAGIFTFGIGGLGIFYHRQRRKNPLKEKYLDEKS